MRASRDGMSMLGPKSWTSMAVALVMVLGITIAVVALRPGASTLARYFSESSDSSAVDAASQQIDAFADPVAGPDYGDWNWFDRQTNETSLDLTNESPTTMVATIRIASVVLSGPNAEAASGKAKAWVLDRDGGQQQISAAVTTTPSTAQFDTSDLRWTLEPGQSTKVIIGTESNSSTLLSQSLVGAEGARFDFRFAVDWGVDGLTAAEESQLYQHGALGSEPGDRSTCPTGASSTQECRGVTATVKKPVITVSSGEVSCRHSLVNIPPLYVRQTIEIKPTVTGFQGVQKYGMQRTGDAGDYLTGYTSMSGGTSGTGDWITLKDERHLLSVGYTKSAEFVIRGKGGSPGHTAGPNGDRDTQSPLYRVEAWDSGLLSAKCSVTRVGQS